MQVTLKLFATLMPYLPSGSVKNAINVDVRDDITIDQIIDEYNVPKSMVHLVLLNGIYIPAEERNQALKQNDILALWPPVAGG